MIRRVTPRLVALAVSALLTAAGCASAQRPATEDAGFVPPAVPMARSIGVTEGEIDLVARSGYADDGRAGLQKADWVSAFENKTSCKVMTTVASSSDEMISLMMTGRFDAVSAPGDATLRLVAGGDVAPINTSLVPNYADIYATLKNQPWNTVAGQTYGLPQGRGASVLMYNTAKYNPPPTSWASVFEPSAASRGKITDYDSPMYIADAALYLMKKRPELGVTDPYELTQPQLDAAVTLLKNQRGFVGSYWGDVGEEQVGFDSGIFTLGAAWPVTVKQVTADNKVKVGAAVPVEGVTGWADSWMIGAKAVHPNCAYEWLNWMSDPKINSQVAQSVGEAPANSKACDYLGAGYCADNHASDENYWRHVWFWTTPSQTCRDSRAKNCTDYQEWITAWNAIRK